MRHKIKEHVNHGYKIEKKKNRHHLKEIATNQYISDYGYSTEAKEVVNKYKLGGGFNGWTPAFMMANGQSFSSLDYIDDEEIDEEDLLG